MSGKRVLVLVLCAETPEYTLMERAIRETWGAQRVDGVEILYYFGHRDGYPRPEPLQTVQVGDIVICGCDEGLHYILGKTLMAYEHAIKNLQFDYLFRCCLGSYIIQENLLRFVQDKPPNGFYCGLLFRDMHGNPHFASGSGYFLSRDLVELIVSHKSEIVSVPRHGFEDDIAVGQFLLGRGYSVDERALWSNGNDGIRKGFYHYHPGPNAQWIREIHKKVLAVKQDLPDQICNADDSTKPADL